MRPIIFVGTKEYGLWGNGKVGRFFDSADAVFEQYEVNVLKFQDEASFLSKCPKMEKAAVILIYNETSLLNPEALGRMQEVERFAANQISDLVLVHRSQAGLLIDNRKESSEAFAKNGILVPGLVTSDTHNGVVFSNASFGSGRPVQAIEPGAHLDPSRHNTDFINTKHSYKGREYYVCLRAMCVGDECVTMFVRARDTKDGSPSVHTRDTPVDAELLNFLYTSIITPNQTQILSICKRIGEVLGIGLYSHDLLPCSETGKIYLCETGVKFDDALIGDHLRAIKDKVVFPDLFTGADSIKAAHTLVRKLN